MLDSLLNILFGCAHRKTTFPLTPSRGSRAVAGKRGGACGVSEMRMRIRL